MCYVNGFAVLFPTTVFLNSSLLLGFPYFIITTRVGGYRENILLLFVSYVSLNYKISSPQEVLHVNIYSSPENIVAVIFIAATIAVVAKQAMIRYLSQLRSEWLGVNISR